MDLNAAQRSQAAVDKLNQEMAREAMDIGTRNKIVEFAHLNRRALSLHVSEADNEILEQIRYSPDAQQQQEPNNNNNNRIITKDGWSTDYFEDGSMRYLRKIVALQQLSYAHLFQERLSESVPEPDEVKQFTVNHSLRSAPPTKFVRGAQVVHDYQEHHRGNWERPLASYTAALVPRSLEQDINDEVVLGACISDMFRINKTL